MNIKLTFPRELFGTLSTLKRLNIPDQTRSYRIFWRNNPNERLKCYELLTVTNGTASAPYLAIRCLHELAKHQMSSRREQGI